MIDDMDVLNIAIEADVNSLKAYQPGIGENLTILARNIVRIIDKFIKWIVDVIKWVKNLFRKFSIKLQSKFGATLIYDPYGYMSALAESSPIINDYFTSLQNLRSIDIALLSNKDFWSRMEDKFTGSDNNESYNKQRGYVEKWIKNIQNIEIYDQQLNDTIISLEKPEIGKYPSESYTPKHIDNFMKRNLYSKLDALGHLKNDLEVTKKFYNDKNWIFRNLKNKDAIKRNNECLKYTNRLMTFMNKFVELCASLLITD